MARKPLITALLCSLGLHIILFSLFIFSVGKIGFVRPLGKSGSAGLSEVVITAFTPSHFPLPSRKAYVKDSSQITEPSHQTMDKRGEGGEGGASRILQKIRAKIERHKHYPLLAKRQKMEGKPLLEFSILPDGSLKDLKITKSSGFDLLDQAALNAVNQASPLPYYPESIQLEMTYHIR